MTKRISVLETLAARDTRSKKLANFFHYSLSKFTPGNFPEKLQGIEDIQLPSASVVFLCLAELLEFPHTGREEKVAWSIPFKFESRDFVFILQKFGLHLYGNDASAETKAAAHDLVRKLNSSARLAEGLLEPLMKEQADLGNITLRNRFVQLNNRYWYFRFEAEKRYKADVLPEKGPIAFAGLFQKETEGSYYVAAMLDAYFSHFEHLLVLLLAYARFDPAKDSLYVFTGENWDCKLKRIIKLDNKRAREVFHAIHAVKERHRNYQSHGNFLRSGRSLHIHNRGGAISVGFSSGEEEHPFGWIEESEYKRICAAFDSMDQLIKDVHPFAYKYVSSGLDIAFDQKSRDKFDKACSSEEDFNDFLELEHHTADMHANMDW